MCQATGEWHEVRQCEHGEQGDSLMLCRRPRATSRQCFSPGWLVEQWGGDATSAFVDDGLCPCHTRADRSLARRFRGCAVACRAGARVELLLQEEFSGMLPKGND